MEPIAIKSANAAALRQMADQLRALDAQFAGAVNALALALDVPSGWQFDTSQMAFVPPPAPPATEGGNDG